MQLIFETPLPLAILGSIVALILLLRWRSTGQMQWLAGAFIAAALVPAAFWIEQAVTTPEEEVVETLYQFSDDYREGRLDAVLAAISTESLALHALATKVIDQFSFRNERITDIAAAPVEGSDAYSLHFRLNAEFTSVTSGSIGHRPTRWDTVWIREDGRWKLRTVDQLDPVTGKGITLYERLR